MTAAALDRRPALLLVALATALGALFRFYRIDWAAPYFHFHIDEHFVFMGADLLRQDPEKAAMSPKFFMYSPGPMYVLNLLRDVYERFAGPLDLTVPRDQVTYMVMGRAISATAGTLTIPAVYLVAARAAGRVAGLVAAVLLACAVMHLRESHFFTVDASLSLFSIVTLYFLVRTVQLGDRVSLAGAGVAFGLAVLSKYTAVFLAPLIVLAHLMAPQAPRSLKPIGGWLQPVLRSALVGAIAVATFLILDPLVIQYWDKFRGDIREQVTEPLLGIWKPIFFAHFADIGSPRLYWFTNLLWWGLGPAFEIAALGALVWLVARRDRVAALVAAYPVVYFLVAGRSVAPFMRYAVPLASALAVVLGVAAADWLRRPRLRRPAMAVLAIVIATTALWAAAYMNVYTQSDARLRAARWLMYNVPRNSTVLVEPHHNIPPTGTYLTAQSFYGDYVMWGPYRDRHDYYRMFTLDTYRYLYDRGPSDEERRHYIQSRLAMADWIVMDDTYLQWYRALDEENHSVVKQYYEDLFAGKLGFELVRTFKVYPELFGWTINDDSAELSFRLFDHPRVYVFRRTQNTTE